MRLLLFLGLAAGALAAGPGRAPVFPAEAAASTVAALVQSTAFVRGLKESDLEAMVPTQSGLFFVDCPNCESGRQEGQLAWNPEKPEQVYCRYCGHSYPSEKYPDHEQVTVRNPRGEIQHYPYWKNESGYRHFFRARRDDLVRAYLAQQTRDLALLYQSTREPAYARRAALLLNRFAEVFPGWCYHYDYPFQQKEIYSGNVPPEKFRPGYRTARWTWWAYADVPLPLVEAYDWIRWSGELEKLSREKSADAGARIENDLFRSAAEQVLANREAYTNMSPYAWRTLITLGRVIEEPRYVHEPVSRLRRFMETRFFYDASWPEGSPDYAAMTLTGLERVLRVLDGYRTPEGFAISADARLTGRPLEAEFPLFKRAEAVLARMRFPDGRHLPLHDSWSTTRRDPLTSTRPYLLPAAALACLGGGAGENQAQLLLTWSGGYGHQHADNLSLMLFAHGREMLSDLGYTHTRHRAWTLSTAAHNTVVVDGLSQESGGPEAPSDGSLRWFDASDPFVQVVSAEGQRGYPAKAPLYRRSLMLVDAGDGRRYAVDLFEAKGGRVRDYFLHGDADQPASVSAPLDLSPLPTLLPAGSDWAPAQNEGEAGLHRRPHWAYGYLRALRAGAAPAEKPLPVLFEPAEKGSPRLRVTLIPEAGSRLILGENPAVRGAEDDDSKLDRFMRPFLALRHEKGDRSAFAAVLEPFTGKPFITGVERLNLPGASLALKVRMGRRTDLIVIEAQGRVSLHEGRHPALFTGRAGLLSLEGEKVRHAYVMGKGGWRRGDFRLDCAGPSAWKLRGIEKDGLLLDGAAQALPPPGEVIRLVTSDGWTYPFHAASAGKAGGQVRIRPAEGAPFTWSAETKLLKLLAFPQREHKGDVSIQWMRHAHLSRRAPG